MERPNRSTPTHTTGANGSSITSILVYDGDAFGEQYDNAVFFADHNQQWVKVMKCDAGYTSCGTPITVISQAGGTTRLAQGPDGEHLPTDSRRDPLAHHTFKHPGVDRLTADRCHSPLKRSLTASAVSP